MKNPTTNPGEFRLVTRADRSTLLNTIRERIDEKSTSLKLSDHFSVEGRMVGTVKSNQELVVWYLPPKNSSSGSTKMHLNLRTRNDGGTTVEVQFKKSILEYIFLAIWLLIALKIAVSTFLVDYAANAFQKSHMVVFAFPLIGMLIFSQQKKDADADKKKLQEFLQSTINAAECRKTNKQNLSLA